MTVQLIHQPDPRRGYDPTPYCWRCLEQWPCRPVKNQAAGLLLAAVKDLEGAGWFPHPHIVKALVEAIQINEEMKW